MESSHAGPPSKDAKHLQRPTLGMLVQSRGSPWKGQAYLEEVKTVSRLGGQPWGCQAHLEDVKAVERPTKGMPGPYW